MLQGLTIEDEIITIELANLSLFLMSKNAYEQYTHKFGFAAEYPDRALQCLLSCAVEDKAVIEHVFSSAQQFGGSVLQPVAVNEWDQEVGYVQSPDGHVWEIVHIAS